MLDCSRRLLHNSRYNWQSVNRQEQT